MKPLALSVYVVSGIVALSASLIVACSSADDSTALPAKDGVAAPAPGSATISAPTQIGPNGGVVATTTSGLPCDVDSVLKSRCQTCHSAQPQFGANTSLVTWDDLQKPGPGVNASKKVYELVKDRIHNDDSPMPPSPKARLEDKDASAIDAWIAGGVKSTATSCTNEGPGAAVKPLSCTPDTVLKATKPFTMPANAPSDQYVCYGVDINLDKKRHVVGLAPKVDNKQIVHHILLFQTTSSESTEPFPCEAFGSASWKLIAGWAPGGNNLELPPEAGLPEEKGTTHWVLQVHYNSTVTKTGSDQSGYELCTTETLRANDAGVLAFGSTSFNIPPRSTHSISCDYALGSKFNNVKLFNASPHMHTMGSAMKTERLPGGTGAAEPVFDQKNFSFEAQANYPITTSVSPGDVMRTHCTWKNPSDATVSFGEKTGDEMCFDFIGYYPNIPDEAPFGIPLFTWVTPSQTALCTDE